MALVDQTHAHMPQESHPDYRAVEVPGVGRVVAPREYQPLPADYRAERLFSRGQLVALVLKFALALAFLAWRLEWHGGPTMHDELVIGFGIITVLGFVMICYRALLFLRSFSYEPWRPNDAELMKEPPGGWPAYNVVVPMYLAQEPNPLALVQKMVSRLSEIDYPLNRLRIIVAVEGHDLRGRAAVRSVEMPPHFRVVELPKRRAKGKPGATVHALLAVMTAGWRRGVSVIFDLEDGPDKLQLRLAAHQYAHEPPSVVCLQAPLDFRGEATNWITRLFTNEYAMWFRVMLPGLGDNPVPLGGTSNHYRTEAWLQMGILDADNKTEDCAAGTEIARRGWKVKMLASSTMEDPNWLIGNWIGQRTRWVGGYILTLLVYMRHPFRLWRELGTRRLLSWLLNIGYATFSVLINPLLWALTALYFVAKTRNWSGITNAIQSLFPLPIYYLGMLSMVLGFVLMGYMHLAGAMERGLTQTVRAIPLLPVYWLLMWVASVIAALQICLPWMRLNWFHTRHHLLEHRVSASQRLLARLRGSRKPEAVDSEFDIEFEAEFMDLPKVDTVRVLVPAGAADEALPAGAIEPQPQ